MGVPQQPPPPAPGTPPPPPVPGYGVPVKRGEIVAGQRPRDVLGRRIGAAVIDVLLMAGVFFALAAGIGELETDGGEFSASLEGGDALLYFAIVLGYYFAFEAAFARTLGKLIFGVKVVSDTGERAGVGQIAGRTAMRVIDTLPVFYLVGFIAMLATGDRAKRLGDMAADTAVIRA